MIYFMQPSDGGPIKIGTSVDVDARRQQLQMIYGRPFVVLRVMRGGRKEEREIHERFAHLRLGRTEQFRPETDLMTFIGRPLLIGSNAEAVEAIPQRLCSIRLELTEAARDQFRVVAAMAGMTMATYARSIIMREIEKSELDSVFAEAD